MIAGLLLTLAAQAAAAPAPTAAEPCDEPVLMVVAGPTHDRTRMAEYARAIADSGLYQRLGGYYLNSPRELARFEGAAPPGYTTLVVRFPCLANARAFWFSDDYQQRIRPLRLDPSAGDYVVSVYPEVPLREDMRGKVAAPDYLVRFDGTEAPAPLAFTPPAGLVMGVDAPTAELAEPGGGWPMARKLRSDPATGEAWQVAAGEAPLESSLHPARVRIQVYVLDGVARIGADRLSAGDMLHAEAGAELGRLTLSADARLLLFREAAGAFPATGMREVVRGTDVGWRIGTVSRDAGAPAPLEVKPLWSDPASGAQLHLVRVAPGVSVPWEVHPSAEEGYLLEGDYRLAECLPSGRRDFDYRAEGYFYRPAALIHSGPQSFTRAGATWLIRTPSKLSAVFYASCPEPGAALEGALP